MLQNVVIWIVVRTGHANPDDAFATRDGKEMFARSKLVILDALLMACAPMELVFALMVRSHTNTKFSH